MLVAWEPTEGPPTTYRRTWGGTDNLSGAQVLGGIDIAVEESAVSVLDSQPHRHSDKSGLLLKPSRVDVFPESCYKPVVTVAQVSNLYEQVAVIQC